MRGATWVDDDTIIVSDVEGLKRVSVSGGTVSAIAPRFTGNAPKGAPFLPVSIPGSDLVVFTIGSPAAVTGGTPTIAILDLSTNVVTPVHTGGTDAQYVASGHLVYTAGGSLWAVRFDPERLQVSGTPVPVVTEITVSTGDVVAAYAVSETGTFLYTAGDAVPRPRTLVWVDRNGRETPVHQALPHRTYLYPRLSDDETRVALDVRDQQNDIWILHLGSKALVRFTTSPLQDRAPVWAGNRLLFGSNHEGRSRVFWQAFDRKSPPIAVTAPADVNRFPVSVTPDGSQAIVWQVAGSDEASDLLLVDLSPENTARATPAGDGPKPLVADQNGAINGIVSPNGAWLAYEANDTGNWEIYVRPFPDGGAIPVSSGGGRQPLWSRSGDELFYLTPRGMVSVRVRPGPNWSADAPKHLFSTEAYYVGEAGRPLRSYDVSRDGSRFLMLRPVGEVRAADEETEIIAVENWFEDLKRLVGK
jgi:serine/threonine-protein kinase